MTIIISFSSPKIIVISPHFLPGCGLSFLDFVYNFAQNAKSQWFPENCNNYCDYYLLCRGGGGAAVNQETRHLARLWPRLCVFCGQEGVQEGGGRGS